MTVSTVGPFPGPGHAAFGKPFENHNRKADISPSAHRIVRPWISTPLLGGLPLTSAE